MNTTTYLIRYDRIKEVLLKILLKYNFSNQRAEKMATIFTTNSLEGVYSHGVHRFPRFISYLRKGFIAPEAEPYCEFSFNAFERWDGKLGAGCINAEIAMDRAIELASLYGVGCVALRNTNHWLRGGELRLASG